MGRYNTFQKGDNPDKQLSTSVRTSTLSFTLSGQHVTCLLQLSE